VRWLDGARRTAARWNRRDFQVKGMRRASPSTSGKTRLVVFGVRGAAPPLTATGGRDAGGPVAIGRGVRRCVGCLRERFGAISAALRVHNFQRFFRAGAEGLVMSAIEKLPQARAAAHIQSADSLRGIQFVAEMERRSLEGLTSMGIFSGGLHASVWKSRRLFGGASDFLRVAG